MLSRIAVLVSALMVAARMHAQGCAGELITTIEIRAHRASPNTALDDVARKTTQTMRSWFPSTRANVVRAFLRVREGDVCTELRRRESERLLRAQPFIASAVVRAIPDGPGHVRIEVSVVDEFPIVVGGGLSGGRVETIRLGSLNLAGRGLSVSAYGTRGFAYRNGFGAHVVQYGAFGRPYSFSVSAERNPRSDALSLEFANPFLTELQRSAFEVGVNERRGYASIVPTTGPDVALNVRRVSFDVGWVSRLGKLDRLHIAGFVGGALLGERTRIGDAPTIVSDTGLILATNVEFGAEYPNFKAVRVVAIAGLRSVRFMPVRGFDALTAQQDVGVGIQMHALIGPSVQSADGRREIFATADLYAGAGNDHSFASVHMASEARGLYNSASWEGMVTSARFSWYASRSPTWTRTVSINAAAVRKLDFPAQLTFRDADGGVAGFIGARAAGGQRVVARVEQRRLTGLFRSRGDLAVAAFAEAGKLWAGEVPYGQTTPIRSSLGLSLLAAYPAGGKRTYRIDVAVPLNPERGGARIELRVSALDRTRLLWLEPRDVARVRSGAVPAALMKW